MFIADGYSPISDWFAPDAAALLIAARERQMFTVTDLFLPESARLREDDRALIAIALAALVGDAEHALRARLADAFADRPQVAAALAAQDMPIARPILDRARALHDGALVAVLARHAAQVRLTARLERQRELARALDSASAVSPLDLMAADADPVIAGAARACLAAHDAPLLPAEMQHRLVWRIAAALRDHLTGPQAIPPGIADTRIAAAAEGALAGYDEAETPAARARSLALALNAAGRLDAALADQALAAGEVPFAVAVLAVRAGIGCVAAWDMMADPARLLLLCRAADLPPAGAVAIAVRLDTGEDDETLAGRLESYASLPREGAAAAIALWRCDPAYRDSIVALGIGRGA